MKAPRSLREGGFSLLEVLVAFVIMALSLGVLYQTLGGSVRGGGRADETLRAVLLAHSLLARHQTVPPQGLHEEGEDDGYGWTLSSAELPALEEELAAWPLHELVVELRWGARDEGYYRLLAIRPEVDPARFDVNRSSR